MVPVGEEVLGRVFNLLRDDVGTPDALWYLAVNSVVQLTSPRVGSDATALVDTGIVCRGTFEGAEALESLDWARDPAIACWDNTLDDEFFSAEHVSFALAEPVAPTPSPGSHWPSQIL